MRWFAGVVVLFLLASLSGCTVSAIDPVASDAAAGGFSGKVVGGQQPVVGATVTVWVAGTSGYGAGATSLATTTSGANGIFSFSSGSYTCPYSNAPVYLTAAGGNSGSGTNANLVMAAGLGSCVSGKTATVDINEVTTAATAFALSHFFRLPLGGAPTTDLIGGHAAGSGVYNVGLVQANATTIPTLVNLAAGTANVGSGTVTIESAKLNSIANTLAACVNSSGQTSISDTTTACGKLFLNTAPTSGARPADTFQAAVQMALFPWKNVTALYNLATGSPPFVGLSSAPNDWTVGISYTTASMGLGINGSSTSRTSSNIDIDASGRVWFPTNMSSAHGLAYFDPVSGSFNGPYATGLAHPQYVAIDNEGRAWGTDLSANQVIGALTTSPSTLTTYTTATGGVTGPIAVTRTPSSDGLLYVSTAGSTSTLYTELSGALASVGSYTSNPTGLGAYVVASTGNPMNYEGDVATSGSSTACMLEAQNSDPSYSGTFAMSSGPCLSGGFAELDPTDGESAAMASSLNQICSFLAGSCFAPTVPLNGPEGIAIDGDSHVWIANSGNGSVSTLLYIYGTLTSADYMTTSTLAYLHDSTHGATMTKPYGLAIDRSGNVWVANASCVTNTGTACVPSGFTLSELVGAAAPTTTPLAAQITTVTVATRPSLVRSGGVQAQRTARGVKR